HPAAVGQNEVDGFRAVQRTAPTNGDDAVDVVRAGKDDPRVHFALGRVLLHAVESEDFQARFAQDLRGALRVAGVFEAGVGDQKHARAADGPHRVAEVVQSARRADDAAERLKVKRWQFHVRTWGRVGGRAVCKGV